MSGDSKPHACELNMAEEATTSPMLSFTAAQAFPKVRAGSPMLDPSKRMYSWDAVVNAVVV